MRVAVVLAMLGLGCGGPTLEGSGVVEIRRVDVEPFLAIDACCEISVEFVQDAVQPAYVEVWTDDNLQGRVQVRLDGGTLRLEVDGTAQLRPKDGITARVFAEEFLQEVDLRERASFSAFSLATDQLTTTVDGASSFWIGNLTAATFWTNVLDGSGAVVEGRVTDLDARVRNGSEAELGLLSTDSAKAVLDDGSFAEVWVDTSLEAIVRGKSTLAIWGEPTVDDTVDNKSEIELLGSR